MDNSEEAERRLIELGATLLERRVFQKMSDMVAELILEGYTPDEVKAAIIRVGSFS